MLIYLLYKAYLDDWIEDVEFTEVCMFVLLSIFALPIDICLSPIEIIATIIYKIVKKRSIEKHKGI